MFNGTSAEIFNGTTAANCYLDSTDAMQSYWDRLMSGDTALDEYSSLQWKNHGVQNL